MKTGRNLYRALAAALAMPSSRRWLGAAAGFIGGLFIGRIIAESSAGSWELRWLLPLAATCAFIGGALGYLASRRIKLAPLLLAGIYIAWPQPSTSAALIVAGFTLVILLIINKPAWPRGLALAGAVAVFFLALYIATLAPGLPPADSGEFQLVSAVL